MPVGSLGPRVFCLQTVCFSEQWGVDGDGRVHVTLTVVFRTFNPPLGARRRFGRLWLGLQESLVQKQQAKELFGFPRPAGDDPKQGSSEPGCNPAADLGVLRNIPGLRRHVDGFFRTQGCVGGEGTGWVCSPYAIRSQAIGGQVTPRLPVTI